jgi:two-component system CheB/CheR fusion protein
MITSAPFTRMDLITCRNVLIYFNASVQRKVLSLFHFALNKKGALFLGPSESIADLADEFDVISPHWKIFEKRRDVRVDDPKTMPVEVTSQARVFSPRYAGQGQTRAEKGYMLKEGYEALLKEYVESGLLVNAEREILHVFGRASELLKVTHGELTSNVVKMVTQELGRAITAAIHKSTRSMVPVTYKSIKFKQHSELVVVDVTVIPLTLKSTQSKFYFIGIKNQSVEREDSEVAASVAPEEQTVEYADLHAELQYTKETLQSTNEELETSNEELQAANEELVASNEELQSTNEELQSTNEELQSTNEELRSVNEELQNVNTEYQHKIIELTQLTNDVQNLLNSTDIGTIFLDKNLKIRKFTPAVTKTIKLLPQDAGRSIEHFSTTLDIAPKELNQKALNVLETGELYEKEVSFDKGWIYMRIIPYLNSEKVTEGIVLVLVDITSTRNVKKQLKDSNNKLHTVNQQHQDFTYMVSHELAAPMRHLNEYLDEFKSMDSAQLSHASIRENIDLMDSSLIKMNSLIQGLLKYSRVYSRGEAFEYFNLKDTVRDVLVELGDKIKKSGADISTDGLETIKGDKRQIKEVLYQLIDNSLSYSVENNLLISIQAIKNENDWLISIKDNGVGIENKYLAKVFNIFSNVSDNSNKKVGKGIGLPLVRRIIERHKGEIWAEPDIKAGLDIRFILPFQPDGI